MMTRIVATAAALVLSASAAHAQEYTLDSASFYELGCHGVCQCPMQVHAQLIGTYTLTYSYSDPLYEHYTISDIQWSAAELPITGTGTYTVGGEVAVQQEMVLDLNIAGSARHVDSGLVPFHTVFPAIAITVDNHLDNPLCYDTVIYLSGPARDPRYCTPDFDGDGVNFSDADIEAFFACIAGNCCQSCASPDFNGDGDVANDADIESFFRVLAGGNC